MFEFFLAVSLLSKTNFILLSEVLSNLVKGSFLVKLNLAIFVHSDISQNLLFKGFLILQEINLLDLSRFFTVQLSMFLLSATAYLIYHFKLFLSTTFYDFFRRPNSTNQCVSRQLCYIIMGVFQSQRHFSQFS